MTEAPMVKSSETYSVGNHAVPESMILASYYGKPRPRAFPIRCDCLWLEGEGENFCTLPARSLSARRSLPDMHLERAELTLGPL